jgi:hypothetical protein
MHERSWPIWRSRDHIVGVNGGIGRKRDGVGHQWHGWLVLRLPSLFLFLSVDVAVHSPKCQSHIYNGHVTVLDCPWFAFDTYSLAR